ncbi:MAG: hypothetical protein R2712_26745 [Vicinamibacterales bacterium]
MSERFIYDERTSRLFAPDGRFLKRIHCPKAKDWNQLIADDPHDRSRGCEACGHRVLNLDVAPAEAVLRAFGPGEPVSPCVYASAAGGRVVFLRDRRRLPRTAEQRVDSTGSLRIRTARSVAAINRAAGMGYWPDVRWVVPKTKVLKSKWAVGQHPQTGHVTVTGDYRSGFPEGVHQQTPFRYFYPYYQRSPIAAYLLPPGVADGTRVVVIDPIEDRVGGRWNQGDAWRATHLPGRIQGRTVVLEAKGPEPVEVVG